MKGLFLLALTVLILSAGCATPATIAPPAGTGLPLSSSTPIPTGSALASINPTVTSQPSQFVPSATPSANQTIALATPARAQTPPSIGATTKTYTDARLGITLDYPGDWSVVQTPEGAKFTSPQGTLVNLALIDTKNELPEDFLLERQLPNTRCSNSTNPHGIKIRNCFDSVSFSYNANLIIQLANNTTRLVSLDMRSKTPSPVFEAMVASVRLVP